MLQTMRVKREEENTFFRKDASNLSRGVKK